VVTEVIYNKAQKVTTSNSIVIYSAT